MALRPKGIDHVVLRVRDVEKSLEFYCKVLGLTLERARPEIGLWHIRAGFSMIDLVAAGDAAPPQPGNMDHFCISMQEWDEEAIHRLLDEKGIEYSATATRFGAEGTGLSLYIKDPDGNSVELKGPSQGK